MCIQAASIPVSKGAAETKELQEYLKTDDRRSRGSWTWRGTAGGGPGCRRYAKISGVLGTTVTNVMLDQVSAKAGLAAGQREAQQLLDEDVRLMK